MSTITTGDDVAIPIQLYKKVNGVRTTFAINVGATVKAVLTTLDRSTTISAVVTLDNNAAGADLATSLIIFAMTEAESGAISQTGDCLIEIQVDDGGKTTFTAKSFVYTGNIS